MAEGMLWSMNSLLRLLETFVLVAVYLVQIVFLNFIIIYHNRDSSFSFLWFLGDFLCLILFCFSVFVNHRYHQREMTNETQRSQSRLGPHLSPRRSNCQNLNESGLMNVSVSSNPKSPSRTTLDNLFKSGTKIDPRISGGSNSLNDTEKQNSCPQQQQKNPASLEDCTSFPSSSLMFGNLDNNKLPITYMSWLFYGFLIIMKVTVILAGDIAQLLPKNEFYGPHTAKFLLGLSAIVFCLLIDIQHSYAGGNDPLRSSYLSHVAFGVAIEILDSISILCLLFPPMEKHHWIKTWVIVLAAINFLLPALTIYKLSISNFGRAYHVPLEALHKFCSLILVNVPFIAVRIYLWQLLSTDSVIFIIKNIWCIVDFFRGGIYSDIKLWRQQINQHKNLPENLVRVEEGGDQVVAGSSGMCKNRQDFEESLPAPISDLSESECETLYRNSAGALTSETEYPSSSHEAKLQLQALHEQARKNAELKKSGASSASALPNRLSGRMSVHPEMKKKKPGK